MHWALVAAERSPSGPRNRNPIVHSPASVRTAPPGRTPEHPVRPTGGVAAVAGDIGLAGHPPDDAGPSRSEAAAPGGWGGAATAAPAGEAVSRKPTTTT